MIGVGIYRERLCRSLTHCNRNLAFVRMERYHDHCRSQFLIFLHFVRRGSGNRDSEKIVALFCCDSSNICVVLFKTSHASKIAACTFLQTSTAFFRFRSLAARRSTQLLKIQLISRLAHVLRKSISHSIYDVYLSCVLISKELSEHTGNT
jgi:hypothetical protein